MSRRTHRQLVGKLDQVERERCADELTKLVRVMRGEWRERCRRRAEAAAPERYQAR
ncbi:MAG: hypothetical protein WKF73_18630 [Nocardioidaceae bacterium]|jgi:hypothetical protein